MTVEDYKQQAKNKIINVLDEFANLMSTEK
jgi:hypothetical protein